MKKNLCQLKLTTPRDLVAVRQRARQIAHLLGYSYQDQAAIAAGVFLLAVNAYQLSGRVIVHFELHGQNLHVVPETAARRRKTSRPQYQLVKSLPRAAANLDWDDLSWMIRQLSQMAPVGVLAEIHRQNDEMLNLLHELRVCQAELAREKPSVPVAA